MRVIEVKLDLSPCLSNSKREMRSFPQHQPRPSRPGLQCWRGLRFSGQEPPCSQGGASPWCRVHVHKCFTNPGSGLWWLDRDVEQHLFTWADSEGTVPTAFLELLVQRKPTIVHKGRSYLYCTVLYLHLWALALFDKFDAAYCDMVVLQYFYFYMKLRTWNQTQ